MPPYKRDSDDKSSSTRRAKRRRTPWIEQGTETCEICGARYIPELEYRCADCDAGLCPQCAVAEYGSKEAYCDACHESARGNGRKR